MAADRAAELTEAYRILSDAGRRAEYDRARRRGRRRDAAGAAPHRPPPSTARRAAGRRRRRRRRRAGRRAEPRRAVHGRSARRRDEFVARRRSAGCGRRSTAVGGGYDEIAAARASTWRCVPKSKLFGRSKNPRAARRASCRSVDREAVADAWTQAREMGRRRQATRSACCCWARRWRRRASWPAAIAEQRRKSRGAKLTLIPVDARDWDAHMPLDAPAGRQDAAGAAEKRHIIGGTRGPPALRV